MDSVKISAASLVLPGWPSSLLSLAWSVSAAAQRTTDRDKNAYNRKGRYRHRHA